MFLYNISIHVFNFALQLVAVFKPKAKQWVVGRKNWQQKLQQEIISKKITNPIWMHCASLGEFEQGRPVIELLKKTHPNKHIVLTFFSPSGFEVQKKYPYADVVCYLPIDTLSNATQFISLLKPTMALFVKYEFWLNYLFTLKKSNIPCFLISTVIKKHQPFFKWYGGIFRKGLATYRTVFTQDEDSLKLLLELNITTGKLAGDTRFDRVLQIGLLPKKIKEIEFFPINAFTIVAGSSWQQDEEYLITSYINLKKKYPQLKLIIAPHEIDKRNIDRLKNLLYQYQLSFNLFSENNDEYQHSILVINTIGLLSSIYQYGTVAFIGGGFNNGIHNILEPMVYGLPVLFGSNYHKFNEAFDALKIGAGFEVKSSEDIEQRLTQFLDNEKILQKSSEQAKSYVKEQAGATQKIVNEITHFIL